METSTLGKIYKDSEAITNQGEAEDCMYVVQSGKAVVVQNKQGKDVFLAELGEGDFFGEMAIFEHEVRSATVRAQGEVCVLTVDKRITPQDTGKPFFGLTHYRENIFPDSLSGCSL